MLKIILFGLAALTALAADSPWQKVVALKTGSELRIFKKGFRQPVLGTLDEANDERLIVVVKNEEIAIQKDDIDRIDYRPGGKSHGSKETHTTQSDSSRTTPVGPQPKGAGGGGPSTSTTTSFGSGSKPDFETIYRRTSK